MPKRNRHKKEPKRDTAREVAQIFFGEGNEEITERLIVELVAKGWKEEDVREFAEQGYTYCRPRNSFIGSPELEGLDGLFDD